MYDNHFHAFQLLFNGVVFLCIPHSAAVMSIQHCLLIILTFCDIIIFYI